MEGEGETKGEGDWAVDKHGADRVTQITTMLPLLPRAGQGRRSGERRGRPQGVAAVQWAVTAS